MAYTSTCTCLFRDKQALRSLRNVVAPQYNVPFSVASVVCSSGEEVYSTALALWYRGAEIHGYDLDEDVLSIAPAGKYPCLDGAMAEEFEEFAPDDRGLYVRKNS
jgi:chemotaxis methyl-accepting protein methylase